MFLESDIKAIANYAESRIMWITPNEAKRLGAKKIQTPAEFPDEEQQPFTPNRFASLGVIHIIRLSAYFTVVLISVANNMFV